MVRWSGSAAEGECEDGRENRAASAARHHPPDLVESPSRIDEIVDEENRSAEWRLAERESTCDVGRLMWAVLHFDLWWPMLGAFDKLHVGNGERLSHPLSE